MLIFLFNRSARISVSVVLCLFFVFRGVALASDSVEEVVVTSSRVSEPVTRVGTSVSVISREEVEAYGNFSLVDILRQQPSVSSGRNGGAGQTASMRIRGEEGFRTLVILDGMRLLDASSPQVTGHVEHLLSEGVERVEILRGPQGLAYGADAGGVVNISSRQVSSGIDAGIDMQTGKYGTRQASGHFGAGNSTGDMFLSLTELETDGFNSRTDDLVLADDDGYENTTLHFRGGLNLSGQTRLSGVYHDVSGGVQYDGCGFPTVHDCYSDFDQQSGRVSLTVDSPVFTHEFSFTETDTVRGYFTEGVPAFSSESELKRAEYVGAANQLPGFKLVFGADHEVAVNGQTGRDNTGIFLQYLSEFSETLFINAGLRHDENEDFGNNTSFRLTGAWLTELGNEKVLKVRGSYGTGFRAPSPYEIEYNRGAYAYPPASLVSLKQETSEGFEMGIELLNSSGLALEAVYFSQYVEDAIEFDLAAFSGYLQERGTSTSRGLELVGRMPLSRSLMLRANYTYNNTARPNGSRRLRRPVHLLNTGFSWQAVPGRLNLNAFLRVSRDAVDEGGRLDDFEVVDLTAGYQLTHNIRLTGRIENILGEKYQEVMNYRTAERAAYLGFSINFAR